MKGPGDDLTPTFIIEPLFTELLDGLALVSEYQEPEPFGLLGLLDKQLACVRRGHVHLSFLVAVVGGGVQSKHSGRMGTSAPTECDESRP